MKILVPVKRVIDPYLAVRLQADGMDIVRDGQPHTLNPFDASALARAALLRRQGEVAELVVAGTGPAPVADTLRAALAMGADRAIHILTDTAEALPPLLVAELLARLIDAEKPDLVMMGKQASDDDAHETAPLAAGLAGLPFLPDIHAIELRATEVHVRFDLDGVPTNATAPLPAFAACDLHIAEPGPVGLAQVMQAKKKPLDSRPLTAFAADLACSLPLQPKRLGLAPPPARPPCRFIDDAAELLALMRDAAEGRS